MKTIFSFILIWMLADHSPAPPPVIVTEPPAFGATSSPEARKAFDRALLLLHNFEYPDARDLFREAQSSDPTFALAYWGEAMTYNHPVWHNQDAGSAMEVVKRYKQVSQRATQKLPVLEQGLIRSLDFLYGDGDKPARDKAYADFMSTLYEKHKGNHEVAAFYALSLLGLTEGWDTELCNRAAEISGAILKENPVHPGALHYFIHAEDHPEYARLAWEQANDYARVASYSGHALHMPSHIYLALGLWDDVVRSNEVSWQAGVDRKEAKKLTNDALNYHAHWWLEYAYLQQGRFEKAEEILRNQFSLTRALPSKVSRTHFVIMRGHYLLETNDWQNALASEAVKTEDLRIEIRTLDRFIEALKAYRNADVKTLRKLIAASEADISSATQIRTMNDGVAQCGAQSYGQTGLKQADILKEQMMALASIIDNDQVTARAHFKKAVDLEEQIGHFFGPPEIMRPTHEFYGEFLLSIGQADQAIASFEKALRKAPGRNLSLHGLKTASQKTGDKEKEEKAAKNLLKNLRHSPETAINGFFSLH